MPDDDLGLIYMNARFYLPGSGRFASADTIVPDPADPQSHNRYSYGLNNPVKYRDSSGHAVDAGGATWGDWKPLPPPPDQSPPILTSDSILDSILEDGPSVLLLSHGAASNGYILFGELTNAVDGGQSVLQGRNLRTGEWVSRRFVQFPNLDSASRKLSILGYSLIVADYGSDHRRIESAYAAREINKDLRNLYHDAAVGELGFNVGYNTLGYASSPAGSAVIGGVQLGVSRIWGDPGETAGKLWAIIRVGEITLSDGSTTTGVRMLVESFLD